MIFNGFEIKVTYDYISRSIMRGGGDCGVYLRTEYIHQDQKISQAVYIVTVRVVDVDLRQNRHRQVVKGRRTRVR